MVVVLGLVVVVVLGLIVVWSSSSFDIQSDTVFDTLFDKLSSLLLLQTCWVSLSYLVFDLVHHSFGYVKNDDE